MAQLYPQAQGNRFTILVAFYDMHGLQRDFSLIPVPTRDTYLG